MRFILHSQGCLWAGGRLWSRLDLARAQAARLITPRMTLVRAVPHALPLSTPRPMTCIPTGLLSMLLYTYVRVATANCPCTCVFGRAPPPALRSELDHVCDGKLVRSTV